MRLLFALVAVATAGCGGNDAVTGDANRGDGSIDARKVNPTCAFAPPPAPTAGSAELGAVDPPDLNNFTVVTNGGYFQSYSGPQGGYHLWIDVRTKGIDPGDGADILTRPQTKFNIYTSDNARVSLEDCAYRLAYHDGGDGYLYLSVGWLNQVLPEIGYALNDTPLRLKIEVLDRQGNYAVDERQVIARKPIPTPIGP